MSNNAFSASWIVMVLICCEFLLTVPQVHAQGTPYVTDGTFTIGGSSGSYYPVRFTSAVLTTITGATTNELVIFRDNVHENGTWFGSFYFMLSFHPMDWGNMPWQSTVEKIVYQTGAGSPYNDPVGDVADGSTQSGGNDVIVWLKGGATYHWRNRDTTAGWTLTNGNSGGSSIIDSSNTTRNPITFQSQLVLSSKNTFYVAALNLGTANNFIVGGNVGVGVTSPSATLEVNGSMKLSAGSGGSLTFWDGSTQSTAWTGSLCGGDYAESVDVAGDRHRYGPGDVLQIDDDDPSRFVKVTSPYSKAVAGVYSTKPGALGRRQATPKSPNEVPLAMIGIVPVKVTAENGPIRPHDLLVSSTRAGYAMKGTDSSRMLGAVIGKAMGSLDKGDGMIEVLVTLQ